MEPKNARNAGIETIFQDKALAPRQTVARNIFMGRELLNRFGLISDRRQAAEADVLLRRLGFTSKVLDVNSPIAGLSGGEQEGVAIARALYFKARLLILDEPTTALSLTQSQQVLELVFRARNEGVGIISSPTTSLTRIVSAIVSWCSIVVRSLRGSGGMRSRMPSWSATWSRPPRAASPLSPRE